MMTGACAARSPRACARPRAPWRSWAAKGRSPGKRPARRRRSSARAGKARSPPSLSISRPARPPLVRPPSAPRPRSIDMPDILYPRLAVIGAGLIGSSVIRAARAAGVVGEIAVADPSAEVRQRIVALRLADEVTADPAAAARGADLVIFAAPPLAIGAAAGQAAGALKSG